MAQIAKFLGALFFTNLKSVTALRGSFLLSMTFMALNNFTFFVFWWVLFGRVGTVRGWQMADVELLFGVSAAGFGLMQAVAGGAIHLGRFIEDGALEPLLTQPKPILPYVLGCRSQASGFGDMASGVFLVVHSGYVGWTSLPLLVVCVLASAVAFTATAVVLFSLAFWVKHSQVLSRQLLDILITVSLYPDPLFGGVLRLLLFTVLPAGIVAYLPMHALREGSLVDLGVLLAAVAAYVWLAVRVFNAGLRRYSSGSRFGMFG
jgi:ABC-2 type transport system permease protein